VSQEGDVDFIVTPTGLLADFTCMRQPILDMSRNPNEWIFKHMQIKVPAEHEHLLDDGSVRKYPAEIHLVHKGTEEHAGALGIVAVWLEVEGGQENTELERYIEKWEEALDDAYAKCNNLKYDDQSCSVSGGGSGGNDKCSAEREAFCCGETYRNRNRMLESSWDEITYDSFDRGLNSFTLESSDALISRFGSKWQKSSPYSLRLSKTAAVHHKESHDVQDYKQLRVEFFFKTSGVDPGEKLVLEYSHDDGHHWEEVKSWIHGVNGVQNDIDYEEDLILTSEKFQFTDVARLRFKTNGGGSSDKWYLDNIAFSGSKDESSTDSEACSREELYRCCPLARRLEGEFFLRGGTTQDVVPNLTDAGDLNGSDPSKHPRRRLNFSCNRKSGDYFCPYLLYEGTENPVRKTCLSFLIIQSIIANLTPLFDPQYYHRYYGSLTCPPCTEAVRWRVMIDPLPISKSQLHRLEMLVAKYVDQARCKLGTWGKPRSTNSCKVDVNRPVQYLSKKHEVEDCEKYHDGGDWSFESAGLDDTNSTEIQSNITFSNQTAT